MSQLYTVARNLIKLSIRLVVVHRFLVKSSTSQEPLASLPDNIIRRDSGRASAFAPFRSSVGLLKGVDQS